MPSGPNPARAWYPPPIRDGGSFAFGKRFITSSGSSTRSESSEDERYNSQLSIASSGLSSNTSSGSDISFCRKGADDLEDQPCILKSAQELYGYEGLRYYTEKEEEIFFNVGPVPRVDYVSKFDTTEAENVRKVATMEKIMVDKGFFIQTFKWSHSTSVLLIYIPHLLMKEYAQRFNLRVPVKSKYKEKFSPYEMMRHQNSSTFYASFKANKARYFDLENPSFSPAQRAIVIEQAFNSIVVTKLYDCEPSNSVKKMRRRLASKREGTNKEMKLLFDRYELLADGVFKQDYIPHEPDKLEELKHRWGVFYGFRPSHWGVLFKPQPLNDIKNYFGGKFAVYYAFYGHFNYMTVYLLFVGLLTYLFGFITQHKHQPNREICAGVYDNFYRCPLCLKCDFTRMSDKCDTYTWHHIYMNIFTIIYAASVSLWSGHFYFNWKRYISAVTVGWDAPAAHLHNESARRQFIERFRHKVKTHRINPETLVHEPNVSLAQRLPGLIFGYFLVTLVVLAISIFYSMTVSLISKMVMYTLLSPVRDYLPQFVIDNLSTSLFIPTMGAKFVLALPKTRYYGRILQFCLNKFICHKTQSSHDSARAVLGLIGSMVGEFGIYVFTILFHDLLYSTPAKHWQHYWPTGETFFDTMWLWVKQWFFRIARLIVPSCQDDTCYSYFSNLYFSTLAQHSLKLLLFWIILVVWDYKINTSTFHSKLKERCPAWCWGNKPDKRENKGMNPESPPEDAQWAKDYGKRTFDSSAHYSSSYGGVLSEYYSIALVSVLFPLAPIVIFILNSLVLRMQARRMLLQTQRQIPQRGKSLQFYSTMISLAHQVGNLMIAVMIAFQTDLIPQLVHYYTNDKKLEGYINTTQSFFDANIIRAGMKTEPDFKSKFANESFPYCIYGGRTEPPWHHPNTPYAPLHWHVTTFRCLFVMAYMSICYFLAFMARVFYIASMTDFSFLWSDPKAKTVHTLDLAGIPTLVELKEELKDELLLKHFLDKIEKKKLSKAQKLQALSTEELADPKEVEQCQVNANGPYDQQSSSSDEDQTANLNQCFTRKLQKKLKVPPTVAEPQNQGSTSPNANRAKPTDQQSSSEDEDQTSQGRFRFRSPSPSGPTPSKKPKYD